MIARYLSYYSMRIILINSELHPALSNPIYIVDIRLVDNLYLLTIQGKVSIEPETCVSKTLITRKNLCGNECYKTNHSKILTFITPFTPKFERE